MTDLLSIPDDLAQRSIAAAVAAGLRAYPAVAAETLIDRLSTSLGPVVQQILTVIEAGAADLPAILQAIQTAGVTLPSWVTTVAAILLVLAKPAS